MAKTYKTPGVYIEEIPKFPPSVAQVDSAVPIFIGYTEKATDGNLPLPTALIDDILIVQARRITSLREYELYFGKSIPQPVHVEVQENKTPLKKYTITVSAPPAATLYNHMQLYFANGGGPCFIVAAGNAATPVTTGHLLAGLKMAGRYDAPSLTVLPQLNLLPQVTDAGSIYTAALQQAAELKDRFVLLDCFGDDPENVRNYSGTVNLRYGAAYHPYLQVRYDSLYKIDDLSFRISTGVALSDLPDELQTLIKEAAGEQLITIAPCSAVAGVYARTDNTRGVWKAPANVSLNLVSGLTQQIDDDRQNGLNVDTVNGKSINVIRFFTGKGFLIWGARTLAGNDNEWRYVPVQRFITMVAESAKKATAAFIFEPNDANTWLRIKAMLANFLTNLWRQGAMPGAKPEQAFYVRIGLHQTMTDLDILEGRLIIEMGIAAVRPAEFIIVRYTLITGQPC